MCVYNETEKNDLDRVYVLKNYTDNQTNTMSLKHSI